VTDGRYDYTKPWVANPSSDPFSIGAKEMQSPNFEEDAPLDPNDVFQPIPQFAYNGPWASNMERLTSQALMANMLPGAQLQAMVRPPLPQLRLFPNRFGFGERTQPSIDDVVSLDRVYQEPRVSWYSGSPAGYSGSSRNSLGAV